MHTKPTVATATAQVYQTLTLSPLTLAEILAVLAAVKAQVQALPQVQIRAVP